jgi:hypothetical protein
MRVRTFLIIGILVREAFSFWTAHPFDFEIWVRTGYSVANGMSPYSSMPYLPGLSIANDFGGGFNAAIGYLPLWPLVLGAIYEIYSLGGSGNRFLYYFMVKQPIIFADVLLAFLLFLYVKQRNPERAQKVMMLWLFSPFTIILSGMWGIFDSIAMSFVMLALLAPQGRVRSAWEGVAILVKSIPVIFILPLSYSREKKALNFFIALGIPIFFTVIVVLLTGWPNGVSCFLTDCPTESVLTTLVDTLAKKGFPLSLWGTLVYLNTLHVISDSTFWSIFGWGGYLWIPAVAIASLLAYRWFGFGTDRRLIRSMLLVTLTFLLVRGQVNEQYAVYLFALLLIEAALWSPKRFKLFYAMSVVIIAATVTNNFLLIRFLAPVYPDALQLEAQLFSEIGSIRNALLYVEGLAFSGLNIWYLATIIKERRALEHDLPA